MVDDGQTHLRPLKRQHGAACEAIARALPEWFGMEEGLLDLRRALAEEKGIVAEQNGEPVGFVTLVAHFPETWEITWLAVDRSRHRVGIGRLLVEAAVDAAMAAGARFLLAKTLADTHPSPEYAQTRAFYASNGFARLSVLPDSWGPDNPCLELVRPLSPTPGPPQSAVRPPST